MEEFAMGYLRPNDETKTKPTEAKESPELKAAKEMIDAGVFSSDKSDVPWAILTLMLVFGGFNHHDRGSEYWRGKYDALKEQYEHGEK